MSPASTAEPEAITSAAVALPWRAKTVSSLHTHSVFRGSIPQLSERDSIFATHYLAADNTPTTLHRQGTQDGKNGPPQLQQDDATNSKLSEPFFSYTAQSSLLPHETRSSSSIASLQSDNNPNHPDACNTVAGRAVEIPRDSLWSPIRSDCATTLESSQGPRNPNVITGPTTSDLPSPFSRTKSYGAFNSIRMSSTWDQGESSTQNNPPPAREALRAGEEAISYEKRNRSSSKGRVEKRIEATLADAEPASNTRSRKASHFLGLFKENTGASEQKGNEKLKENASKKKGMINKTTSSDGSIGNQYPRSEVNGRSSIAAGETRHIDVLNDGYVLGEDDVPLKEALSATLTPDLTLQSQDLGHASDDITISTPRVRDFDSSQEDENLIASVFPGKVENRDLQADSNFDRGLPLRLLEEIRNHHNLTPPFHDRFKGTHVKPVHQDTIQGDVPLAGISIDPKKTETSTNDEYDGEEGESDKEQISSALYYPHQAPSPSSLEDVDLDEARQSAEDTLGRSDAEESILEGVDEKQNESGGVDIALQSQDRNRYLHGDLQKLRTVSEDYTSGKLIESSASSASASESDYESFGEVLSKGDKSLGTDDGEVTPTATPNLQGQFFQPKAAKLVQIPAAPLGAVELKPYKHQVGGHTTVFRFSKRAVCKELSNRENEFYEVIERRHPELLKFLPRYVFFLNCYLSGLKAEIRQSSTFPLPTIIVHLRPLR